MHFSSHPGFARNLGLLLFVVMILAGTSKSLQAQPQSTKAKQATPTQTKPATQATPGTSTSPAIDVKVETFRKQIVAGSPIGVVADITNNSNAPVYFREQDVQLVLPPEVERPDVWQYSSDGWFPTEYMEKDHVISLKPKETYRIFWHRTSETAQEASAQPASSQAAAKGPMFPTLRKSLSFISFTPGTYPITVEVKYWDQNKFEGDTYHTAVETKPIEYSAPQGIVLLGAILGGLIFTVLSMVRKEQSSVPAADAGRLSIAKGLARMGLTLLGSVLLSVIITVLISRIEETQFFIKVSVSDFWGAIAVGFLANYGGWALLDKMIPTAGAGTSAAQKQAQAKAASVGTP